MGDQYVIKMRRYLSLILCCYLLGGIVRSSSDLIHELSDDFPERCDKRHQEKAPCKCLNQQKTQERGGSKVMLTEHVCDTARNVEQRRRNIIPPGMVCEQIEDYKFVEPWNDDILYKVGCELRFTRDGF